MKKRIKFPLTIKSISIKLLSLTQVVFAFALILATYPTPSKALDMKNIFKSKTDLSKLNFTCAHEAKPPLSPDTQILYDYARYHDLHNMWNGKNGDEIWQDAARYYRIAAANGDYKANVRLQYLIRTGRAYGYPTSIKEVLALNDELAKSLPATAMYHTYIYVKHRYGLRGKPMTYLRKAADMGSKDAQYKIGEMLGEIYDRETLEFRKSLRTQLFSCASEQGSGNASENLGISLKNDKQYEEAFKVFHQGVKNGNAQSALRLADSFRNGLNENNKLDYLALKPDAERQIRYEMIENFLFRYDHLNPTVPDLDSIVPLPPAKLPKWDGKIAFQRWYEGQSPEKPNDELINRLAQQAGLDPQTGLPLKKKKRFW